MMTDNIRWRNFQIGSTILNREKRRLILLDNSSFNISADINYVIDSDKATGEIGGRKIEISGIKTKSCRIDFDGQQYFIHRLKYCLKENIVRISYKRSSYIDFHIPRNIYRVSIRKALVADGMNHPFRVNISKNPTLGFALRVFFRLLTLGLIKQKRNPLIPPLFVADRDMEKALILGIIFIQMIAYPGDYTNSCD